MKEINCTTCSKEINKDTSWKSYGRDYDDPTHFCSDSCRMMFPFKKKTKEEEINE